jgi:endonuclease/exonuclease/phosphatase family metal-dependent hydrolase
MKFPRSMPLVMLLAVVCSCHTTRVAMEPVGPQLRVLTYNINWGSPRPDLVAEVILQANADVVCLQETTSQWEQYLRQALGRNYRFMSFRFSQHRMGGGLGFLAKLPMQEAAYIPSETGWFDGWIMKAETDIGSVQFLNVHLRPPISDKGSWVSGYFTTGDDRRREIEEFYGARQPQVPTLVMGDFNDGGNSPAVRWLETQGLTNALPQFDHYGPTWKWRTSVVTLRRRMDHILYSAELDCSAARVIPAVASDHLPVEAIFTRVK